MDSANTQEEKVKQEIQASLVEVKEHPNFRTINVGGVYGTYLDTRFEIIIYSEHLDATKALASPQTNIPFMFSRTLECRLVIDPFRAKSIVEWLIGQINTFEKTYGHILTTAERQEKVLSVQEEAKKKTNGVG
jgi:hypothetical protein